MTRDDPDRVPRRQTRTFAFDARYDFTFRVSVKDLGMPHPFFHVDIFVDYSSITSGTLLFRDESTLKIRFAPQMRTHALIFVDDLTVNYK